MRVTVCFGPTRVIVPCKGGATVAELAKEACARYKRALGKSPKYKVKIHHLEHANDCGILDSDDYVYDVAVDRDQLIAIFEEDDQTQCYNTSNQSNSSGSDGSRSPHSYHHHINHGRFSDTMGIKMLTSNDRFSIEHEVDVCADALKSGSNPKITVRIPTECVPRKTPWKKSMGYRSAYEKNESFSQAQSNKNNDTMTTGGSSDNNYDTTSESLDKNNTSTRFQSSHGTYFPEKQQSFIRGIARQSTIGLCSPNSNQDRSDIWNDICSFSSQMTKPYIPPASKNPNFLPRFYYDSQEMFVDVDKRPLGIKVGPYKENRIFLGLLVEFADADGRSIKEGLFHEGDIIVEINSCILAQHGYSVAQEIFRNALKLPELQFRFYPIEERNREVEEKGDHKCVRHAKSPSIPILSVEAATSKPVTISAAKSLPNLNDCLCEEPAQDADEVDNQPLVARMSLDTLSNNTRKIGKMFVIELKKEYHGLGFSITTRDTTFGDTGPIYVKNILPKGAAILDGRLRAGDRLLKVNEIDLIGHTQESAVNILRCIEVGSIAKLVVSRQINTLPRKMKDDPITDKVLSDDSKKEYFKFEIALNDTGSAGLGISLKGNQSKSTKRDLGIFVKAVFHGGAAFQDGRLKPNDQLMSVNGQSLMGMTNHEAIDTLRTSMSTVGNVRGMIQMVIARRTAGDEPVSSQYSSEASSEISDSMVDEQTDKTESESGGNQTLGDGYANRGSASSNREPTFLDASHVFDTTTTDEEDENCLVDPFSRESIFRQSISEKRKIVTARTTQDIDSLKMAKIKQSFVSDKEDRKIAASQPMKQTNSFDISPLKWVKPSKPSRQDKPSTAPRNDNNSSNLSVTVSKGDEVQVGPTLGIAKSSSLESLQTAVENFIDDRDFPNVQSRVLRGRVLNESFRAALDQSYDIETLTGKPITALEEERSGSSISSLVKSDGINFTHLQARGKKKDGRSYKFLGIFRVGKIKRGISTDHRGDSYLSASSSSSSSSPRLTECEIHKKLLESKREDDFKKHQAESERIQAKAKEMRERQEQRRKSENKNNYRENLARNESVDRERAPSVPVTAMHRLNVDPKSQYFEASSGRRSVDPNAMRGLKSQVFSWSTSKRPTSPVVYSGHNQKIDQKSSVCKPKINPDYSSLPRKSAIESNTGELQNNSNGALVEEFESASQRIDGNFTNISNSEFYNMQKPQMHKLRNSTTPRKGRPEKPKTVKIDQYGPSAQPAMGRSKTPQPHTSCRHEPVNHLKSHQVPSATVDFATIQKTFQREQSPEPPLAVMRTSNKGGSSSSRYRHSVHIDNPISRISDKHQLHVGKGQKPQFSWKKAHPSGSSNDYSDKAVGMNRHATKKFLNKTPFVENRPDDNFVISQPYNL